MKLYSLYKTKFNIVCFMKAMLFLFVCFFAVTFSTITVSAEEAVLHFGSSQYAPVEGTSFPIGVYIESEVNIGEFSIELQYDPAYLTYESGATEGGNGTILITGNANGKRGKYMLYFSALKSGDTAFSFTGSTAYQAKPAAGEEKTAFTITEYPSAPISIQVDPNREPFVPETEEVLELTNLLLNEYEPDLIDTESLYVQYSIPYTTAFYFTTEDDYNIISTESMLSVGANHFTISVTNGVASTEYEISVLVAEPIVESTSEPVESNTENVAEVESNQTEQVKPTVQPTPTTSRNNNVVVVVVIIVIVLLIVTFVLVAIFLGRAKKETMIARTDEDEDSEIEFDSLYD